MVQNTAVLTRNPVFSMIRTPAAVKPSLNFKKVDSKTCKYKKWKSVLGKFMKLKQNIDFLDFLAEINEDDLMNESLIRYKNAKLGVLLMPYM